MVEGVPRDRSRVRPVDARFERDAYWLASSRDEDTLMVPVYDMANHSNDPVLLNTLLYKPERARDAFLFVASRDIVGGGQVYNSYNRCNACSDARYGDDCETYSFARTPDLFVRFGFVKEYPQNWVFDPTTTIAVTTTRTRWNSTFACTGMRKPESWKHAGVIARTISPMPRTSDG